MRLILDKNLWKVVLFIWIFIWVFVFLKNLIYKGYLGDYAELLKRTTLEEKRSYVTGDALYSKLQQFNRNVKEPSTFGYEGIEASSLADRRIRYYLYPHLKSDNPDYLIIFDGKRFYTKKAK